MCIGAAVAESGMPPKAAKVDEAWQLDGKRARRHALIAPHF
jgi:hypothetical protein